MKKRTKLLSLLGGSIVALSLTTTALASTEMYSGGTYTKNMTLNVPVVLKTGTKNSVTNYVTNQLTSAPYLSSIECRVLNGAGTIIGTNTCYVNTVKEIKLNNTYTPGTYLQLQGKTNALLAGVTVPVSGTVDFQ